MPNDLARVALRRTYSRSVKVIGRERLQTTNCGFGERTYRVMLGLYAPKSGMRQDGVSTTKPVGSTSMSEPLIQFGSLERASSKRNVAGDRRADEMTNARTAMTNSAALTER